MSRKAQNNRCLIYLADLIHNYASRGPHTYPLNIGYIYAYAKKIYGDKVEIKLFKFPSDLICALKNKTPDIIGLGNYTWNLDINNRILFLVKSLSKDTITVYGGPDYPAVDEEACIYLKNKPALDFFVINHGERGFAEILERYFRGSSILRMKQSAFENCSFYNHETDRFYPPCNYRYIENLDEIPSPYLAGLMDEFFDSNLIPVLETNRGCPYTCIYCAWGRSSQRNIFTFSPERVSDELEYIAKRVNKTNLLIIGDANFGILDRDVEIVKSIRKSKEKYNYPRHIYVGWAKGAPDRVIEMAEILSGMVDVTCSFQTLDKKVAANIRRANIDIGEFRKIQRYFVKKHISTVSEMILGLPGETRESHLKALKDMFENDSYQIYCYNLRMLGGSDLKTEENREKFGIKTKFRLIDGGFGNYDDMISVENEEMVLKTSTMTTDDILYFRPIHFLIQFMWNYKYYAELLSFLKNEYINPVDFIVALWDSRDRSPLPLKKIFEDFSKESIGEWFDTEDALFNYYSTKENFEEITKGGFGKLNYKYTYRVLLESRSDFDRYLVEISKDMLMKAGRWNDGADHQLKDIMNYISNKTINFQAYIHNQVKERILEFEYDILDWKKEVCDKPLLEYRKTGTRIKFFLTDEQDAELRKTYEQYRDPDLNKTLRKMVEYMNKNDLFYKMDYA